MAALNLVFLGIKGSVIALDEATGTRVWEKKLKGGDFVNLTLGESRVYATTQGEIFCLDPATGKIVWQNPLTGMGRGIVCVAAPGAQPNLVGAIRQKIRQDEAAAAAAVTAAGS
jgi:hypothetical protein